MDSGQILAMVMLATVCGAMLIGYQVAFTLAGVGVIFALIGQSMGVFDMLFFNALPSRFFGVMTNELLVAVPLFVFMGVMLEKSKIAEELLTTMGQCFGALRGGLGISVTFVGMLLAATTGIVGATVVTMGLLSLPTMLRANYDPKLACGTICAAGTLGQIIPPSVVLVLLGDVLAGMYSEAQLSIGNFLFEPFSVIDLFAGAVLPGLLLVALYFGWQVTVALFRPAASPAYYDSSMDRSHLATQIIKVLIPPLFLILAVLGSILGGLATPTEAASFGAVGAMLLAAVRKMLNWKILGEVVRSTTRISCMVFGILIGASLFSLTFRGLGGDEVVEHFLLSLPGGTVTALIFVMILIFLLGFILEFIEIVFIVVPIFAPALLKTDINPVWFGIMIGLNLQTSFMTPPFGWALFYLRGVAPKKIKTGDIYRGVIPFVVLQLIALCILAYFPQLATWLPKQLFG